MAVKRAAIIGCGDIAALHAEAIAAIDGIELAAVVDTDPGRLERAAARTGVPGYASTAELLAADPPDVAHVTTPHDQHVQPSIECLDAGVHVIQEKPIAHTLAEGQRLVDAAASGAAKIGICFQNRYNVSSQRLRSLLDSGELGEVRGAYASVVWTRTADYYRARPWRATWAQSGGGLLINQAIHTLDLVQWFLGGFESLSGHVATRKFADVIEVEDTAELLLRHPSGVTTSFYGTLTAPQHRPVEIELDCANAYVELRNGLRVVWRDGRVEEHEERKAPSAGRSYWGVSHELLIRDFYGKLDDPEPFWIGPEESMTSLRMLKAAYEASGITA